MKTFPKSPVPDCYFVNLEYFDYLNIITKDNKKPLVKN